MPHITADTTELAVELDVKDIQFTGSIDVSGFVAKPHIKTFLVDEIDVPVSTIGEIDGAKLKAEFNGVSAAAVPILNFKLRKYEIPLPQDIFGIFLLSDIFLSYADGYLYAGATPTFVDPSVPQLETAAEVVSAEAF